MLTVITRDHDGCGRRSPWNIALASVAPSKVCGMCAHVLVAEDDIKQAALIRRCLEHDGHTVAVVHEGQAALDAVFRQPPDLLVLDWMLPNVDGPSVMRRIRAAADLPVLMLTARTAEDDLLLGLEQGADDYMTKPYSPRELMARVRTLLRRTRSTTAPGAPVLRVGPLVVDEERHQVICREQSVACTPAEFAILVAMAAEPGRAFSRRQLLACTEGFEKASTERAIDVHVVNLRKKIEEQPRRPQLLQTVFGVGYRLVGGPHEE